MEMIGHEAVRNDFEVIFGCRSQNLREHDLHGFVRHEQRTPVNCAERKEISVETEVVERLQMDGVFGVHAPDGAIGTPRPRSA
jgi:hypothetical protein